MQYIYRQFQGYFFFCESEVQNAQNVILFLRIWSPKCAKLNTSQNKVVWHYSSREHNTLLSQIPHTPFLSNFQTLAQCYCLQFAINQSFLEVNLSFNYDPCICKNVGQLLALIVYVASSTAKGHHWHYYHLTKEYRMGGMTVKYQNLILPIKKNKLCWRLVQSRGTKPGVL